MSTDPSNFTLVTRCEAQNCLLVNYSALSKIVLQTPLSRMSRCKRRHFRPFSLSSRGYFRRRSYRPVEIFCPLLRPLLPGIELKASGTTSFNSRSHCKPSWKPVFRWLLLLAAVQQILKRPGRAGPQTEHPFFLSRGGSTPLIVEKMFLFS